MERERGGVAEPHARVVPRGRKKRKAPDCLLQFLPRPRNAALHARDGTWRNGSHLERVGIDYRSFCYARNAKAGTVGPADHAPTRLHALQAARDIGRKTATKARAQITFFSTFLGRDEQYDRVIRLSPVFDRNSK